MNAAHVSFNVLKKIDEKINKKVIFISEQTPDRSFYFEWIPLTGLRQIFYQVLKAFDMLRQIPNNTKFDAIFIFEHKPWYSYLLYVKCIIIGRPVFFIVHGLQQTYKKSLFHRIGFRALLFIEKRYNFWPIHLEISDREVTGVTRFSKSIVIPHPLPKIVCSKKPEGKIRIGIVGLIRPDKPIQPLLNILSRYRFDKNIEILIGTSKYSMNSDHVNLPFQLIDTSTDYDYYSFLRSLHIVINNFDVDQYYFRPSGIINDSISAGCFVIAPDYPVFKAQIAIPVVVGKLFKDLNDIPDIISQAVLALSSNTIDFTGWKKYREDNKLIDNLGEQILKSISDG